MIKVLVVWAVLAASANANEVATAPSAALNSPDGIYSEAERTYLRGDATGALKSLTALLSQSPNALPARTQVRAHNLRGLIFFQQRNLPASLAEFEQAVQFAQRTLQPNDSLLHLARYNLGNSFFQSTKISEARENLALVNPEALDADTRMRFHHLFGNVLAAQEAHLSALSEYLRASALTKELGPRDTFLQRALTSAKNLFVKDPKGDGKTISNLELPDGSAAAQARDFFLARSFLNGGESEKAKSLLERLAKDFTSLDPPHPYGPLVESLLGDLGKISYVNPTVIGVLLPLSGKFGRFGRLCLHSMMLAQGVFEEMPENPNFSGVRFAIRDSGETAEMAVERFEELVKEDGAIAVIGPLLSKQSVAVSQRAQEFGVPLLNLSQRVESEHKGSNIFPIALTPQQQIRLIANRAIEKNGLKRFAILAPDDSFGEEYVNLFWDEVEARGGEVVAVERYPAKATDFQQEVRNLVGLSHLGARPFEVADRKRRADQYASTLKVKGRLRQRLLATYDPKGVVDFDAIFIPDDPTTIGQIAPALAVESVENLPLLGINTWNTPEIVQRAGRYLQRSLFVDAFLSSSRQPEALRFVQEFMKHFQSIPGTIEVQAFDAARIALAIVSEEKPSTRIGFRERLLSRSKFVGVSGEFEFSAEGVKRSAHLLTVKGNSIVELPSD
jgi:branched-chain amino acid transport system substrate-binding protein